MGIIDVGQSLAEYYASAIEDRLNQALNYLAGKYNKPSNLTMSAADLAEYNGKVPGYSNIDISPETTHVVGSDGQRVSLGRLSL